MSPLARSLLALAVAALLCAACASPQRVRGSYECTTIMHGSRTSNEQDLPVVYIAAGIQAASIDIKSPCGSNPQGEQVIVCDDVAPSVQLPQLPNYTPAIVTRTGQYNNQEASVCRNNYLRLTPEPQPRCSEVSLRQSRCDTDAAARAAAAVAIEPHCSEGQL